MADDFHTYGLYWDESGLYTYIDDDSQKVLSVDFTKQSFFERGQFGEGTFNPWQGEPNAAPFNREFHIILNLAVGGTNSYFPDGFGKPWSNTDSHSVNQFYNSKDQWYPTWNGEDAALKVDSIKYWNLTNKDSEPTFL